MDNNYTEEQRYLKAKKRVKDIKEFYVHLSIYLCVVPFIIGVNLIYVPNFHWFWFSVLGWGMGIFFHWLGVFGFTKLGLGKDWEERKIREYMNDKKF